MAARADPCGARVSRCSPKDNREHVLGADARPRRRVRPRRGRPALTARVLPPRPFPLRPAVGARRPAREAARARDRRSSGARSCDIGELDVPEPIFEIPGPLARSNAKIDLHPTIGSRWLATTPGLSSLVLCALASRALDLHRLPRSQGRPRVPLWSLLAAVCDC